MHVSACNFWSLGSRVSSSVVSRRELIFNGMSSACSRSQDSPNDAVSAPPISISRSEQDQTQDLGALFRKTIAFPTRRLLLASLTMSSNFNPSRYLSAQALGDSSVTLEEVTPPVFSSGPLFPTEDRIVQLFERNTYSVVNIFDVTLRPQLNVTGVVEIPEGNGSGVVWDEEGHIVTNYHVIGNALSRNPSPGQVVARVNILASEGLQKNFEGKLIGADRAKDLAVLKVEASEDLLRPIKVGESSSLKVGQQCLAIGNPFGFDHTLTVGVISGLNRDIFSQTGVTIGGGIQTDAAINPGNSGGPLLDSKGRLIGINTAIFTQTGMFFHLSYGIFSGINVDIAPDLIAKDKRRRNVFEIGLYEDLITNAISGRKGSFFTSSPKTSRFATCRIVLQTRGKSGRAILRTLIVLVILPLASKRQEKKKWFNGYFIENRILNICLKLNGNLPLLLKRVKC
ncbi:protease Do-like 8, chloroplastic [Senna tora]|uniref:Protease Do-like 8, chloroplastic n=1 Tax=Senna tora TaxID=362788 RepID=A0A834VZ87_9FABA|nr:protease Do-like 8, chloroplastic [Senna tora]